MIPTLTFVALLLAASSALATRPSSSSSLASAGHNLPRRRARPFGRRPPLAPVIHVQLHPRGTPSAATSASAPAIEAARAGSANATTSSAATSPNSPTDHSQWPAQSSLDSPLPSGESETHPTKPTTVTILNLALTVPVEMFQGGNAVEMTGEA